MDVLMVGSLVDEPNTNTFVAELLEKDVYPLCFPKLRARLGKLQRDITKLRKNAGGTIQDVKKVFTGSGDTPTPLDDETAEIAKFINPPGKTTKARKGMFADFFERYSKMADELWSCTSGVKKPEVGEEFWRRLGAVVYLSMVIVSFSVQLAGVSVLRVLTGYWIGDSAGEDDELEEV